MKTSKFNIVIPMDTEGDYLIYNTLAQSHAVVDEDAKLLMERLKEERTELYGDSRIVIDELKGLNIVVDDEVDEDMELEYHFQKSKFDTSELSVSILTTYACNLKCTYCSQEGIESSAKMDMDTALKVSSWLSERMDKIRPETLKVVFYGGEPLLNKEAIKFLSELLYIAARRRNIVMESSIITNGVLLDAEFVERLIPLGLKGVRVTLDGDESAHNSKRRFKDGRGTFDLILKNLEKIKGKVPINLNGNFDDDTKGKLPNLLDILVERGFKGYIGAINFKPILKNIESAINTPPHSPPFSPSFSPHSEGGEKGEVKGGVQGGCEVCTFSEVPNIKDMLSLIKEIEKRGFKSGIDITLGPCEASLEYSYTIDPKGMIYKCSGFVGRKEFAIGDLTKGIYTHRHVQFMTTDTWRGECKGCVYTPLCGGGCRASAYIKYGDFRKVACDMPYFSTVSHELMKEAA
jgi:uncharacterized protein